MKNVPWSLLQGYGKWLKCMLHIRYAFPPKQSKSLQLCLKEQWICWILATLFFIVNLDYWPNIMGSNWNEKSIYELGIPPQKSKILQLCLWNRWTCWFLATLTSVVTFSFEQISLKVSKLICVGYPYPLKQKTFLQLSLRNRPIW